MARYDDAHEELHECVILMEIATHAAGTIIFLNDLADAGYQRSIFSLKPRVTYRKWQTLLNIDGRLPVPVFVDFLKCAFLKRHYNVLGIFQCGVVGWVRHRQVARSF